MDQVYKLLHSIGPNIQYYRLSSNQTTVLKVDIHWVKTDSIRLNHYYVSL